MNKSTSLSVTAVQCFNDHGPVVFNTAIVAAIFLQRGMALTEFSCWLSASFYLVFSHR